MSADVVPDEDFSTPTLVIAVESRATDSGEWIRRASTPALPELVFDGETVTEVLDQIDEAMIERYGEANASWHWLRFVRVDPSALQRPSWRSRYEGGA